MSHILYLTTDELLALSKRVRIAILELEIVELRGDLKFKTDKKYIELHDLRVIESKIVELRRGTTQDLPQRE